MSAVAGYGSPGDEGRFAAERAPAPAAPAGSFWRVHVATWVFIALFGLVSRVAAFDDIPLTLTVTLILEPIGFGLTALAHKALMAWPQRRPAVIVLLVVVFSILGGLLQMAIVNAVKDAFFAGLDHTSMARADAIPAIYYTAIFLGWSLAYFWIQADVEARSERVRRSEAEAAATRAELRQLRQQLDPHFLFNALNTVASEIPDHPDAALEMTHRIAAYLRYSLDQQSRPVCALPDEIEAVRAYVRIQELRFEGRLRCVVEMDPAARSVAVPHLIVQGLVENAVKHGLRSSAETLEIRVTARRTGDDTTVIEVTNPGRLVARSGDRPAVGLANTRRRLELHYPQRHELTLTEDGDTVLARLMLRGPACFA
ncbi:MULTISPECIES: sensor histidine kinase [Inquilinus]|uniref:LytS/YehU family sensor histidine kinase n=1 Tax=Inquilinus ginsengisoli TaxID=363840 RepID=A0ABU1JWE3_9PROT|nr:histidine kinase [Inquilinus ginsengisoli]MDR6292944.1 LytS/YehU family sensor histidine kinase [Inquilinus ginsengisoli]